MTIPEKQLETWSHRGSIQQSASTYQAVKQALNADTAGYAGKGFQVFLQGSYGNETNIYAESDVDIVIQYDRAFFKDLARLSPPDRAAYDSYYSGGVAYSYEEYRSDVFAALKKAFGADVSYPGKAIKVRAGGGRRNADVIPAFDYRRYHRFVDSTNQFYTPGMAFKTKENDLIANFPKLHSANLTRKHQDCSLWFKPTVRIFKNLRSWLVDSGHIDNGAAPSYFIEGLIYNAPKACFGTNYGATVLSVLRWLHSTKDRANWVCANEQYYLLRDGDRVCWPIADGDGFISAAVAAWDNW
ncbi:nucleotidyltransferase domain-containing protein [Devosia alba]|uniref:nucleotidyltransferase domain-containing protein n=1 Tax=Devosia alba TaxID=3152360 RepID=UPI0032678865